MGRTEGKKYSLVKMVVVLALNLLGTQFSPIKPPVHVIEELLADSLPLGGFTLLQVQRKVDQVGEKPSDINLEV